jgi:dTMP kinase
MQCGIQTQVTREPGGTTLGEELRQVLLRKDGDIPCPRAELLLYEAIRAQHVDKLIRPSLNLGKWVLCDRYTSSTVAFQGGGRGISRSQVDLLNSFATNNLEADLTILLDLSVQTSQQRRTKRADEIGVEQDRFEEEGSKFHQAIRDSYLEQAKAKPEKWFIVDATLSPDQVFQSVLIELKRRKWLES